MELPYGRKSFKMGSAVHIIPACERQPSFDSKDHSYALRRAGKNVMYTTSQKRVPL